MSHWITKLSFFSWLRPERLWAKSDSVAVVIVLYLIPYDLVTFGPQSLHQKLNYNKRDWPQPDSSCRYPQLGHTPNSKSSFKNWSTEKMSPYFSFRRSTRYKGTVVLHTELIIFGTTSPHHNLKLKDSSSSTHVRTSSMIATMPVLYTVLFLRAVQD